MAQANAKGGQKTSKSESASGASGNSASLGDKLASMDRAVRRKTMDRQRIAASMFGPLGTLAYDIYNLATPDPEKKGAPEILVLGATLKCSFGSTSNLIIDYDDMDLNVLPEGNVSDCIQDRNVFPFGHCTCVDRPCADVWGLASKWENPDPQRKRLNGEEVITTHSLLMCDAQGGQIVATDSGQSGEFAAMYFFLEQMEQDYPGLRAILDDPNGSLYLNEGMAELAIKFLSDTMAGRQGAVDLAYFGDTLEDAYVRVALERLVPGIYSDSVHGLLDGTRGMLAAVGLNNGASGDILDEKFMEALRAYSTDYAAKVAGGGAYYFQEANRQALGIVADTVQGLALCALTYQYAAPKEFRNETSDSNPDTKDLYDAELANNARVRTTEYSRIKTVGGGFTQGTVTQNHLKGHEITQAEEVAKLQGGHFEGPPTENFPGIDGWLDDTPVSLKEVTSDKPLRVFKEAVKGAKQADAAGYSNVDLYINAKQIPKEQIVDFSAFGPIMNIPKEGVISRIYIQTADGWILIE